MVSSDTIIIGFGHKTKHGKDTAAAHLADKFGSDFYIRKYAFADSLKSEIYDALLQPLHPFWGMVAGYFELPHPREAVATDAEKLAWVEGNKKVLGKYLQLYGTEFRRSQDRFYWIKAVAAKIANDRPKFAFITDVRMPNECLFVKSNNGFTVKCNRLGYVNPDRDPNHYSEIALNDWKFDFEIQHADGNVSELLEGAEAVFTAVVDMLTPKVMELDFAA